MVMAASLAANILLSYGKCVMLIDKKFILIAFLLGLTSDLLAQEESIVSSVKVKFLRCQIINPDRCLIKIRRLKVSKPKTRVKTMLTLRGPKGKLIYVGKNIRPFSGSKAIWVDGLWYRNIRAKIVRRWRVAQLEEIEKAPKPEETSSVDWSIAVQFGSPNSPSSMAGGKLETIFVKKFVLGIAHGNYDSKEFMNTAKGRVRFRNNSVFTAYSLGGDKATLRLGVAMTRIDARYNQATQIHHLENKTGVSSSRNEHFISIHPTLEMVFSDEEYITTIGFSQFKQRNGNGYNRAFGAPRWRVKSDKKVENSKGAFQIGFGFII